MATYELSIIRTPSGKFTFVGCVPAELCEKRFSAHYGAEIVAPLIYDDYDSACQAKRPFEASPELHQDHSTHVHDGFCYHCQVWLA